MSADSLIVLTDLLLAIRFLLFLLDWRFVEGEASSSKSLGLRKLELLVKILEQSKGKKYDCPAKISINIAAADLL